MQEYRLNNSCISFEFAFITKRPVIFINTPMKVLNPEWEKVGITPINIALRDQVGVSVDRNDLDRIPGIISDILADPLKFSERIKHAQDVYMFNSGCAGEALGQYILDTLIKKQKERRK